MRKKQGKMINAESPLKTATGQKSNLRQINVVMLKIKNDQKVIKKG